MNLMIGDWVYSEYLKTNARVLTVTQDYVEVSPCPSVCDSRNPYESIKPITLTAEILEKNKFSIRPNYRKWVSSLEEIEVYLRNEGVEIIINVYQDDEETYSLPPVNYVHELQHALRLCGLTELADNFRIN